MLAVIQIDNAGCTTNVAAGLGLAPSRKSLSGRLCRLESALVTANQQECSAKAEMILFRVQVYGVVGYNNWVARISILPKEVITLGSIYHILLLFIFIFIHSMITSESI